MPPSIYDALDRRVDELATLPGVAVALFERCGDPELRISDVVALIEADQVIASRILRLANSAYYGRSSGVSTLKEAVMVLGLEAVRAVGLSIGVYAAFPARAGESAGEMEQLWQHNLAVALCAREIARRVFAKERERAFVAGLLHDIGQLVLLQYLPEQYLPLLKSLPATGTTLERAEREALGTDHAEVGAWMLERWHLPADLRQPVALHHYDGTPRGDDAAARLTVVTQVANWLATSQGLGSPWRRGNHQPVPASRATLGMGDDALLQLCLGLDSRVSQLCGAMGLAAVSPDVFQKALYRANRALAQMAVDLDVRCREMQHSLQTVVVLEAVAAALARASDLRSMLESAVRALGSAPWLDYAQCMVPQPNDTVLLGTADRHANGALSVEVVTTAVSEWQRLQHLRANSAAYLSHSFHVRNGTQGLLIVRPTENGASSADLDLNPFTTLMGLAFARAQSRRDAALGLADRSQGREAPAPDDEAAAAQAQDDQRLRLLGEMAAGAAHDLNNALAIVLGQAQLGSMSDDIDEARQYLRTIEGTAKDCAATVRRLQEFARGTRRQVKDERLDLAAVARDTVAVTKSRWRDEAQRRGARIEAVLDLPESLPMAGSAPAIREVLTNLVFNAIDAMPSGGKLVAMGRREGDQVRLSLSDTGVGMSAEVRERAFEPFFSTKGENGTGLGLTVCKRIVEEHGGEIAVESDAGVGSTVVLTFPLAANAPQAKREEARVVGAVSLSVLVIDDEPQVREVVTRMLQLDGHQPHPAALAREGLDAFGGRQFDVVLTDLGLPDMTGWDVVRAIKAAKPLVPVVLMTGWTDEGEEPVAKGGVDAVLVKPFGIAELRAALASAVPKPPQTAAAVDS